MSLENLLTLFAIVFAYQILFVSCLYGAFYGDKFERIARMSFPNITHMRLKFVVYSAAFDAVLMTALYWWLESLISVLVIALIYEFLWVATSAFLMTYIRRLSNKSASMSGSFNTGETES